MNKLLIFILIGGLTQLGFANNKWQKFPEWAKPTLNEVNLNQAPEDSSVWILLDDVELRMNTKGKLVVKRKLLRYVAQESGAEDASFFVVFGDENSTKIKSLKGWHLGRAGKIDKLNKRDMVTIGDAVAGELSSSTTTMAFFDDVSKGSVIAFESEEVEESFFPRRSFSVLGEESVREMRIRVSSDDPSMSPKLETLGFDHWSLQMTANGQSIELKELPAIESESYTPDFYQAYPYVVVTYQGGKAQYLSSWNELAVWYSGVFHRAAGSLGKGTPASSLDAVSSMVHKVTENISYRQRYLSPGRGWVPASGSDVSRRAYGDCKDMVACLALEGSQKQVLVQPVLAHIGEGFRPSASSTPGPIFNHLIAGVALEKSFGLPAEIDVDGQLFLIVDPTSNHTEFGYLPAYYRDRQVMIALKDKAVWVEIPEKALEPEKLLLELSGMLDENYTLVGSLSVKETGNAFGFRGVSRENNSRTLEGFIRRQLDLPGFMDMKAVGQNELGDGQIQFIYQIRWPSFLMRDAGGLRLPFAIVDRPARMLTRKNQERELPIYFSSTPQVQWNVQLRCKTPVLPGLEEKKYEDESWKFTWKASGGAALSIQYLTERREGYYAKNDIAKGIEAWNAYREAFNPFALSGAALGVGE